MIQQAKLSQIERIMALTKACGKKMASEGIFQWNETYPNSEAFQKDIKRDELYVFISEAVPVGRRETILGCIVISTEMDEVYKTVNWLTETSNHYYIHRLAVHPDHQGKGIAREMMDFAENLAVKNKMASIRLDTFSKNLRNQKFYKNRRYQRLGSIYFKEQSEFPFYCYELPLNTKDRHLLTTTIL
jgi:ribosomal protein S18 acetylase RimI-like enzyme